MRVPWHGFFALDTKTGTLCRTTNREFPSDSAWVNDLILCAALTLEGSPDAQSSDQFLENPYRSPQGRKPGTERFVHGDDVWDIPLDKVEAFKKKHPEAIEQKESDEEIMKRLNKKYGTTK